MAADPANYQQIQTVIRNFSLERPGKSIIKLGPFLHYDESPVDFHIDTELQLWFAPPLPILPVPLNITKYTPTEPILFTPGGGAPYFNFIYLQLSDIDLFALSMPNGTMPYEVLSTIDGGETSEKIAKGTVTVNTYLTLGWGV